MFLSKRRNIYYLFLTDDLGKRHKISTKCRQKADAVKFLQSFKLQEHERKINLSRISLSEFAKTYLEHSKSIHTHKSTQNAATALSEFGRLAGDLPLHRIGIREIETFLATKKEQASAWTARKYFIALASAFETAKRWGHVLNNPFRQVPKPKVPELQPVFFSRSDFATLLHSITEKDFHEIVIAAVSTGMRQGELLALQWEAVDLSRKVIIVKNSVGFTTKNKRSRVIPMTEGLWKMLLERKIRAASESAFVFDQKGSKRNADNVSKRFKRYVRLAGLDERLHFHSLRHTFASWLALDGVSLYAIQKLLGHSSSSVTQIYSHLQPEQLHATVNRLDISLN